MNTHRMIFEGKTWQECSYWDLMRAKEWIEALWSGNIYAPFWTVEWPPPFEVLNDIKVEIAQRSIIPPRWNPPLT